jgi:hypothetical protein
MLFPPLKSYGVQCASKSTVFSQRIVSQELA